MGDRSVVDGPVKSPHITVIPGYVSNCYLLKTASGFYLIDTGVAFRRGKLEKALKAAGCRPGCLKLVIITHADYDHTGNCAWLRRKFGAKLAAHPAETPALETGRMFASRKTRPGCITRLILNGMGKLMFRPFRPDILLEDGTDLSEYGLDARVICLPGHTTGHIGLLTAKGDLFCGDLLRNEKEPARFSLVDDEEAMNASIARLKEIAVKTVYPGHGRPFEYTELKTG